MPKKIIAIAKSPSLDDVSRMYIFQSYGEGKDIETIATAIRRKFNLTITPEKLEVLCAHEDNKVYVDRFHDDYMARVKDVPIANKRMRLNDFQLMRDRMFKMAKEIDSSTQEGRKDLLMVFRRINEILCASREEMEGKSNAFTQINITELSSLSDEELQRRKEILVAKALGTFKEADFAIGAIGAGAEAENASQSSQVPLAPPT